MEKSVFADEMLRLIAVFSSYALGELVKPNHDDKFRPKMHFRISRELPRRLGRLSAA